MRNEGLQACRELRLLARSRKQGTGEPGHVWRLPVRRRSRSQPGMFDLHWVILRVPEASARADRSMEQDLPPARP